MPDLLALNTTLGYSAESAVSARGSEWTLLTQTGRFGKSLVIGRPGIVALSLLARQYRSLVAWFLDADDEKAASGAAGILGVELEAQHCRSSEVPTMLSACEGQFDLIAIACDIDRLLRDARSTTADFFGSVHAALADDGQCLAVTELGPLFSGLRRKREAARRIPLRKLQRALSFLPIRRTYFLYPDQNHPEEILGWSTELPSRRSSRITRLLDKVGLLGPLHNSAAVLSAAQSAPSLLRTIIDGALSAAGARPGADVERCLARDNGTMTVLLRGQEGRTSSVLRIPLSLAADTRLRNAWSGLAEMRQSLHWLRDLTPEPMASGVAQGMPYFLEHQCAGITADSLVGEEDIRRRLSNTLLSFLLKFEAREESPDEPGVAAFRHLVREYFSELTAYISESSTQLSALERRLLERFDGRSVPLVRVHGDLNPTNVLFDPSGETITGIIDWDACSSADFPMQDIVHFLVHRYRVAQQMSIGEVVVAALNGRLLEAAEQDFLRRYLSEMSIDHDLFEPLIVLYWVRHLALHVRYRNGPLPRKWIRRNLTVPLEQISDALL